MMQYDLSVLETTIGADKRDDSKEMFGHGNCGDRRRLIRRRSRRFCKITRIIIICSDSIIGRGDHEFLITTCTLLLPHRPLCSVSSNTTLKSLLLRGIHLLRLRCALKFRLGVPSGANKNTPRNGYDVQRIVTSVSFCSRPGNTYGIEPTVVSWRNCVGICAAAEIRSAGSSRSVVRQAPNENLRDGTRFQNLE